MIRLSLYRAAEVAVVACALVFLAPLFLLLSLAIVIESGWPVLFRQQRIGLGGRPFTLLKFRSMRTGRPGAQITSAGDRRITRIGAVLRTYKLDELPQLWNVLRGDMRIVGPRPEVAPFVDLADARWRKVLSVPPGITDLATLLYRDEESLLAGAQDVESYYREHILPAKLALNIEYLGSKTWWTDLRLIALTVWYSAFPGRLDARSIRRNLLQEAFSGERH